MGCRAALLPLWVAFDQVLAGSAVCAESWEVREGRGQRVAGAPAAFPKFKCWKK